jgi:DNA-binding PadR family transcriptional regulator
MLWKWKILVIDSLSFIERHSSAVVEYSKSRMMKAFLDIAILNELAKRRITSVPFTIKFLTKKYSVYINAGTAYPIFYRLEKKGYVEKIPERSTQLFIITTSGRQVWKLFWLTLGSSRNFLEERFDEEGDS